MTSRDVVAASALVLAVVTVPFLGSGQLMYSMTVVAILSIAAIGLNIVIGQAGQVNFAAGTFMAFGGYGLAILTTKYGFPPVVAVLVAAGVTTAFALVLSIPLLRVHGHYLAVATFTVSLGFEAIFLGAQDLTGGTAGIAGIPSFAVSGNVLTPNQFYLFAWLACAAALALFVGLENSHIGRAWKALSVREDVARSLGIRTERLKVGAFVLSAILGSISGSLYAAFTSFMSPDLFGLLFVINLFLMLFVGGRGTILGPILGAVIVVFAPQGMTALPPRMQNSVFLVMLLAIILVWPQGILGGRHGRGLFELGSKLLRGGSRAASAISLGKAKS